MPTDRPPCAWCGASRADQVSTSYYSDDGSDGPGEPLCVPCWTREYGDDIDEEVEF